MTCKHSVYTPSVVRLAALFAGASVALLGGLIGLGGAEFRLPLLIAVFALSPHRAIRVNLLITFATLAMSAAARLEFLGAADVSNLSIEIQSMLVGGAIVAFRTPIDDVALEPVCSCDDERRRAGLRGSPRRSIRSMISRCQHGQHQ